MKKKSPRPCERRRKRQPGRIAAGEVKHINAVSMFANFQLYLVCYTTHISTVNNGITMQNKQYISAQEAANRLGYSKQWVIKKAREGKIKPKPMQLTAKRNGTWLFDPSSKIIA